MDIELWLHLTKFIFLETLSTGPERRLIGAGLEKHRKKLNKVFQHRIVVVGKLQASPSIPHTSNGIRPVNCLIAMAPSEWKAVLEATIRVLGLQAGARDSVFSLQRTRPACSPEIVRILHVIRCGVGSLLRKRRR